MEQYLQLCRHILENGMMKQDRTGTGTLSTFGYQMRFDVRKGFPLLTTKKVHFPSILGELLWFISGSTNIRPLVEQQIRIWNDWPYAAYRKSEEYRGETMEEFIQRIKEDDAFALKYGDLGPVYGKQWRNFGGIDQLANVEKSLKEDPFSRRHIISAWNPTEVDQMKLPPCHAFLQFYVSGDGTTLSLQLYQRSADVFLGVPFNIASYALLLVMFAEVTGYTAGEFIHTIGDAHIYLDHIEQVKEQLTRSPKSLPKLQVVRHVDHISDFKKEDFVLMGYDPHPLIKGKVSV